MGFDMEPSQVFGGPASVARQKRYSRYMWLSWAVVMSQKPFELFDFFFPQAGSQKRLLSFVSSLPNALWTGPTKDKNAQGRWKTVPNDQ